MNGKVILLLLQFGILRKYLMTKFNLMAPEMELKE